MAMKLEPPKNSNYAATIVRLREGVGLPGLDNLVGLQWAGYQALVSKDGLRAGELGLMFPPEVQLSHEFASANNLYRHSNLNLDPGRTGYLEDNRRVRAIKLRGHRSDALFMPIESLQYVLQDPANVYELVEGDEFDRFQGTEICCKYVVHPTHGLGGHAGRQPKIRDERID